MAFWKKFEPTDSELCPFCRKSIKSGVELLLEGYQDNNRMCKDCFKYLYKNISAGRTVGYIDNSSNIFPRFLPAPILEKPLFSKRKYAIGYEYRMSAVNEMMIFYQNAAWLIMMLLLFLVLELCKTFVSINTIKICEFCVDILFVLGSSIAAISDLINLIKGFFLGMGHPRRLMLISFIAILTMVIVICIMRILLFIV